MKKITSILGFGLMRLPTLENGKIDYEHGEKMVKYAMDNGVNYFDTADPYHQGESEIFAGEVLSKYDRESYFLTTKMPVWKVEKPSDVKEIFQNQLKKCKTDYFDYYLVHAVNKEKFDKAVSDEVVSFLQKEKEKGTIRNLGFSFHGPAQELDYIISYTDWDFVQLQLNYYDVMSQDAQILIDTAVKHKTPVIVMEPIRGGFLHNCVPNAVDIIKNTYGDENKTSALALSYCFDLPNVFMVLSGMSEMQHIIENINTAKQPIKNDELRSDVIKKVMHEITSFTSVACTKCEYCLPCPVGINIPEAFMVYNDYMLFKNKLSTNQKLAKLEVKPAECIACGQCESHCPQNLKIADLMQELTKEFNRL